MRPVLLVIGIALSGAGAAGPAAAQSIGSIAAMNHVGESMTVCGRVASATVVAQQSMQLSFDQPYPGQTFSVLILGEDRPKFNGRELAMIGRRMCGSGTIKLVQGRAQMTLKDPSRLTPE
jgi:hypothetical protein